MLQNTVVALIQKLNVLAEENNRGGITARSGDVIITDMGSVLAELFYLLSIEGEKSQKHMFNISLIILSISIITLLVAIIPLLR